MPSPTVATIGNTLCPTPHRTARRLTGRASARRGACLAPVRQPGCHPQDRVETRRRIGSGQTASARRKARWLHSWGRLVIITLPDAVSRSQRLPAAALVQGIQPPFTQIPPPIAANGSGVVQEPGAGVDGGTVETGDTQLPLTHVPPPSARNGSAVPPHDAAGCPGGSHPPFTHAQPAPGAGLAQLGGATGVGIVGGGAGAPAPGLPDPAGSNSGGIQPPLTHNHPATG